MNRIARDTFFDLDHFFNSFGPTAARRPANCSAATDTNQERIYTPRVDIAESDQHYQLVAELPGISKDNINITVDESLLKIEASNEPDKEQSTDKVLRSERRFGKFVRSFNLGKDIDLAEINASFKDGLLILTVPKAKEQQPVVQKIEIH